MPKHKPQSELGELLFQLACDVNRGQIAAYQRRGTHCECGNSLDGCPEFTGELCWNCWRDEQRETCYADLRLEETRLGPGAPEE